MRSLQVVPVVGVKGQAGGWGPVVVVVIVGPPEGGPLTTPSTVTTCKIHRIGMHGCMNLVGYSDKRDNGSRRGYDRHDRTNP